MQEIKKPKLAKFITKAEMQRIYEEETGDKVGIRLINKWYKDIKKQHEGVVLPHKQKIPEKWFYEYLAESNF